MKKFRFCSTNTLQPISWLSGRFAPEVLLFSLVFLVNVFFSLFFRYPLMGDEVVTMSEGVFLWGTGDWATAYASRSSLYYGYGYTALLSFFYPVLGNMHGLFRVGLVVNSALIALIPVLSYRMAHRFLELNKRSSFLLACVVGFVPSSFFASKTMQNETMLFFVLWVCLYLLMSLYSRSETSLSRWQILRVGALGFLSIYAYSLHGRGLAISVVVSLAVLFLGFRMAKKWHGLLSVFLFSVIAGITFVADSRIKDYLMREFFLRGSPEEMTNTMAQAISGGRLRVLSPRYWIPLLQSFAGAGFYMVCTTFGLLLVAMGIFIFLLCRSRKHGARSNSDQRYLFLISITALFTVLFMGISSVNFTHVYILGEAIRGEYWIYGRYNEILTAPLVFVVLVYFMRGKDLPRRVWAVTGGVCMLVIGVGTYLLYRISLHVPWAGGHEASITLFYNFLSVTGIVPFLGNKPDAWAYGVFAVVMVGISAAVWGVLRWRAKVAAWLLLGVFVYSSMSLLFRFAVPLHEQQRAHLDSVGRFYETLEEVWAEYPRVYSEGSQKPHALQYMMPRAQVEYIDIMDYGYVEFDRVETDSLLVSATDRAWEQVFTDVYRLEGWEQVGVEGGTEFYWVYGEALRARCEAMGFVCSGASGGDLPLRDARHLQEPERSFLMNDEVYYRGDRMSTTGNFIRGQVGVLMEGDSDVSVNGVFFLPGESVLTVIIDRADLVEVDIVAEGLTIVKATVRSDRIYYRCVADRYVGDAVIYVKKRGDGEASVFRGYKVRVAGAS